MKNSVAIFWFRRDLRLEDNTGLQQALSSGHHVLPVFIFDTDILHQLEDTYDRRVDYIHQALSAMNTELKKYHSSLKTFYGKPLEVFRTIIESYTIQAVYCNRDYEPQAIKRDKTIQDFLKEKGIGFFDLKDQVIFEKSEITKTDGSPYTIYTPYAKKWRSRLAPQHYARKETDFSNFLKTVATDILSIRGIGFQKTDMEFRPPQPEENLISQYHLYRNFPAMNRTTQLGIALRFGTISIRECVSFALQYNDTWLSELIWREFFMQILYHFPKVVYLCFKSQYEHIQWRNNEREFELWREGKTGYPIVDAGMRQLKQTGFMHNRVRMITASFLCKHLLTDWRWGEAYFAAKLNDYDLASNNGNWQWAAGCGCDAAPYFRIFNPGVQALKFDKDLTYIRTWNADFDRRTEPPIVVHEAAVDRALKAYKNVLKQTR